MLKPDISICCDENQISHLFPLAEMSRRGRFGRNIMAGHLWVTLVPPNENCDCDTIKDLLTHFTFNEQSDCFLFVRLIKIIYSDNVFIFCSYCTHTKMFSFIYHCQDFYRTWLHVLVTQQVSYKKQKLLTLREHLSSPPFFWLGPCCSSFWFFVLCFYVSLLSEFCVVMFGTFST